MLLQYQKVGSYSGQQLSLNIDNVNMLRHNGQPVPWRLEPQPSVCSGSCVECTWDGKIPLAFVNGSAYIIGIFSVHERNADNPFKVRVELWCCNDYLWFSGVKELETFMLGVDRSLASVYSMKLIHEPFSLLVSNECLFITCSPNYSLEVGHL